jgi:hypothetical protein
VSWHLTIRSDAAYSRSTVTRDLIELLSDIRELRQSGPASFEAASGTPWLSLVVATADPAGCYTIDGPPQPLVNLVELVCSTNEDATWYDALASRIASALGWEAVEEHEGRRVWPPAAASDVG